jgi:hypothetical protein
MSYRGVGEYYETGMGSYYEFTPHQVYAGFGALADTFDPQAVWADVQAGSACYEKPPRSTNFGACNVAGARATREIQAALSELGYATAVDGKWTSATSTKWKQFLADNQLTPGPGQGISEQGLADMQRNLKAGKATGPSQPLAFEKVNGQLIPKDPTLDDKSGIEIAGLSGGGLLLAALVVGGVGYAVYKSGQKKRGMGGKPTTALARTSPGGGTRLATANPRML